MARRGYVQLSNGFYLNRKVRRLRRTMPSAVSAFVVMLSYCGDNLTDGFVDSDTAEFVLDITTQELDALQQVGLIEAVDGGYVIHDYLEHNRSRQQVIAKRKREHDRYSAGSLPAEIAQTAGRIETESGQTPEHQNTRTQKKEEEYYSSSKEMTLAMFQDSRELAAANSMMRATYPNLDLKNSWDAFATRQYDVTRMVGDWIRLWRGWCENRAQMGGIPPSKPHVHTWACEHTLKALHLQSQDDVTDMASAVKKANELNQKEEP